MVILKSFVVYNNPSDYPGKHVLRQQDVVREDSVVRIVPHKEPIAVVDSLDEVREHVPQGLHNMGRMQADEPHIVEVWI